MESTLKAARFYLSRHTPSQDVLFRVLLGGFAGLFFFLLMSCVTEANTRLGFDVSNASIPQHAIREGGPPPDGIPSIDVPRFTAAQGVSFLEDGDLVVGFVHDGHVRAYPFRVLIWHEIVNDTVGDMPILVTYCPLCGTAMIFERTIRGKTLDFGVSGLLYNSDVLMFDRQTRSLWSQIAAEAVSGEMTGTALSWLPAQQMTWAAWRARYPDSLVLNTDTGHPRDYVNLPYDEYFRSDRTLFPYAGSRRDFSPKDWVVGLRLGDHAKAYALGKIPRDEWVADELQGEPIRFRYDGKAGFFEARDDTGKSLPVVHIYWFAWQAFFPESEVWSPQ